MPAEPQIVTRFAPSPTGYLHIGGARTALFNWLYARGRGGKFLLRIEDTDRVRSTEDAIGKIFEGMRWLGLDWDDEAVFQFTRASRHAEVAHDLLTQGKAYYCYCTPEELEEMRARARAEGRPVKYDGRWRDRDPGDAPPGVKPVIRLKAPQEGETVIHDLVQGAVTVQNKELDDMVLLRGDGTPTYMLSVVVDDHDMGITHVIRGDDHLNNAFRQLALIRAAGFRTPEYAHIPLIHGADGAKLSKRHGALGVEAYRDMGYLPEAMRNYLLRLGWGHGDEEIIALEDALAWFDIVNVGRSPARFDFAKLENLNGHYIREATVDRMMEATVPEVEKQLSRPLAPEEKARLAAAMPGLKERARTVAELASSALFLFAARPLAVNDAARAILDKDHARTLLAGLMPKFSALSAWETGMIEAVVRDHAEAAGVKLGNIAQPLRAALTGSNTSPGIFDVLMVLGKDESLARIRDQAS